MNDHRWNSHRALVVLNSLIIPVFCLFLADKINLVFLMRFSFILVMLITVAFKIYVMGAMAGSALEIITAEEMVFRLKRAHLCALKLWPGFLAAFLLVGLFDFLFYAALPSLRPFRMPYLAVLISLAAYGLAEWTIKQKYLKPQGVTAHYSRFNVHFLLVMSASIGLEIVLGRLSLLPSGGFYWHNISLFSQDCVIVFQFIYCAGHILDGYPQISACFNNSPEIFLINPMGAEIAQSLCYWFVRIYPPVFVVLKALSPAYYKFREFNQVVWCPRYYKSNVLVCITCFTSNCYEAYAIAKEFRKRGAKVVMGGPHVTYLPQEALMFCDSVIIGQAEGVWAQVIRDYENGALKPLYTKTATGDDYAYVHQQLLTQPPSTIKDFLETSRGCKFRCHFCSVPTLTGNQLHLQSIHTFVQLIDKIRPHYSEVTFLDNNIYSDPAYARELFTALKPLKIKWHSQCTIDIAKNTQTLRLARESGCTGLLFGYEVSGSSLEKNQGGKFAMAEKYREYTDIVKKEGIGIKGHFIFGFDSDNYQALWKLWKFCFSIMPQFSVLSLLTPLPGSGVYNDMLEEQRIINLNWRSYGLIRMVVQHPRMNSRVLSFVFPWVRAVFLMTASSGGVIILILLLFFPHYGIVDSLLK